MSRLAAVALPPRRRRIEGSLLLALGCVCARVPSSHIRGRIRRSRCQRRRLAGRLFPQGIPRRLGLGRFYSIIAGGNRLAKNMLKTDIIHHIDRCELSLDNVKIDYNRGYSPMGAFPLKASFTTAIRQTSQGHLYKLEEISRDGWDLKQSFDGKAVLLQGVPRNALPEDIERFLCGTNF